MRKRFAWIVIALAALLLPGAACLAARALDLPDLPPAEGWQTYEPVAAWREVYDGTYARYQRAVQALET